MQSVSEPTKKVAKKATKNNLKLQEEISKNFAKNCGTLGWKTNECVIGM